MKRIRMAALIVASLILSLHSQSMAQSSAPLVLSKNGAGHILRTSFSLSLTANADCDQTQNFIPDGSRLVSESFNLNTDSNGVGTFNGLAQLVAPDGRLILQGSLRGTAGLNTRCGASRDCRLPGHLEGLFEGLPATARSVGRVPELRSQVLTINFSADPNRESASPLPLYRARLDGLVSVPSAERVSIVTEQSAYDVNDPIAVKIVNGHDQNIVTWDHKTNCTIVVLQKQEAGGWVNVAPCPLLTPTRLVTIGARTEHLMKLPPESFGARFEPGTYRLEFAWFFVDGNGQPVGNPAPIYSPQFTLTSRQ
jgi:hypothetical protein